jgi:TolA-binding protein
MKKTIIYTIIFLLATSFLSAQSKKELNLRIDTIQTALNSEKQVAQNLTLQIQNLTTELEKMNKTMILLTSQIVKQDSVNTLISGEIQGLTRKVAEAQRIQDSIKSITTTVVKANLKMKLFSNYVNEKGKLFIREMSKISSEDKYYFL